MCNRGAAAALRRPVRQPKHYSPVHSRDEIGAHRNDAEALASAVDDWHTLAGHALRGWAGVLQTLVMLAKAARRAYFLSALDDDALAHEVSEQEASWVRTRQSCQAEASQALILGWWLSGRRVACIR